MMKLSYIAFLVYFICCSVVASGLHRKPRAAFTSHPLISAYTDIEKGSSTFTIGSSETSDDLFDDSLPEYLTALCKLSAKSEFPDVTISAGYRTSPSGSDLIMEKKLYNGSEIPMSGFVSEVSVEFVNFLTDLERIPTFKDSVIFRKQFQIQSVSKRIPNYPDKSLEHSGIFLTKSEAYPFAGHYFQGIELSDIQPQLFYLGTNPQAETYLNVISVKEALQSGKVKICKDVPIDSLSSLEDDIFSGKVKIKLDETEYSSINAQKGTLISDIFKISFKKADS